MIHHSDHWQPIICSPARQWLMIKARFLQWATKENQRWSHCLHPSATHTLAHTHAVRSLNLLFVFQLNFLQHHKPTGRNGRENKNIKQLMSNRKKMPRGKQNKKKDKSRETLMHCGDCRIQQCCGFSQARLRSSSDGWISLIRGLDLVVFYSLIWALLPV